MLIAPVFVELPHWKVEAARRFAEAIYLESRRLGCRDRISDPIKSRTASDNGLFAEVAFCHGVSKPWVNNINSFRRPDVLGYIQVKCSPCRLPRPPVNFGNLRLPLDSDPAVVYALVVGNCPHYIIQGWTIGEELMKPEFIAKQHDDDEKAYYIPNKLLNKNITDLLNLRQDAA